MSGELVRGVDHRGLRDRPGEQPAGAVRLRPGQQQPQRLRRSAAGPGRGWRHPAA